MVRMYKAGAAYVEVVPVFKDFQRLVSKHLKDSLGNEKAFKDLEGNLQKSVDRGLDNISDKLKQELKESGFEIQKDGKKLGKDLGKSINAGVDEGIDADPTGQKAVNRIREEDVKSNRKHAKDTIAVDRWEASERAQIQREENRRVERQRKLQQLRDAEDEARNRARERASRSYENLYGTARNNWREIGASDARGNAKQQRLVEARQRTIRSAQQDMNRLIATVSRFPEVNARVDINTSEARKKLHELQDDIIFAVADLSNPHRVKVDTGEAQAALERLKLAAEDDKIIDWELDVDDEEAKAALDLIKAELASIRDKDVDVNVRADRHDLADTVTNINAALETIKKVDLDVSNEDALQDIAVLNAAIENIRDKKVGVDVTEKDALADIATINSSLASLDDKNIDLDIDQDGSFRRELKDLDHGLRRANTGARVFSNRIARASISMTETTQAFRVFNPMLAGLAAVGAPAVSAMGGLVASLGAFVSMAPGLAAGAGTMMVAFGGLGESAKKYEKAQEALEVAVKDRTKAQKESIQVWKEEAKVIGPATAKWIEYSESLQSELRKIQKGAREGLLPGVMESIDLLMTKYAGPMTKFLNTMGKQLGDIAVQWSTSLTGPEASAWFSRVAKDAEIYTADMADAGANLVSGFGGLVDAFRPFAQEFSNYLVDATGRFDDWANALGDNPMLERFLDSVRAVAPELGDLAKNIGEFFVDATIALEPFTLAVLDAVNGALDFVNALDPKVLGAILGAIGGLVGGMMLLSGVVAGVGAVAGVMGAAFTNPLTGIISLMGLFVAVSTSALGVTTAMESASGDLGSIMGTLGGALEGAANFTKSLWDAFGGLLEALSPLMVPLSDVLADIIGLGVEVGSGVLVGGLELLTSILGPIVDWFTSWPSGLQEVTLLLVGLGLAVKPLSGVFTKFSTAAFYALEGLASRTTKLGNAASGKKGLGFVGSGLRGVGRGAEAAGRGFAAMEKASVILGIVSVAITGLSLAMDKLNASNSPIADDVDSITASIKGMGTSAEGAAGALDRIFAPKEGDNLGSSALLFAPEIRDSADAFEYLGHSMDGVGPKLGEFSAELGTLFGALGDTSLDVINKQIEETDQALADMAGSDFQGAAAGFREIEQAMLDAGVPQEEINKKFEVYEEELRKTAASLGLAKDKSIDYHEWMRGNIPESVQTAVEAQGRQEEGLVGVTQKTEDAEQATKDLIAANDELSGRFLTQEEANVAYYEAMDKFDEHVKNSTGGIDEQTQAGRDNRTEMNKMASAAKRKADADLEATGDAAGYADSIWTQRDALIDAAEAMGVEEGEADALVDTLLEIPDHVDTEAELEDYVTAEAEQIDKDLDEYLHDRDVIVGVKYRHTPIPSTPPGGDPVPQMPGHDGFVLEPFAQGGLKPMEPVAQMVKPNTWRVVGDRMKDDEAYIPLDGSRRSWSIMTEAIQRMPGTMPFNDGGITMLANGGVTSPLASVAPKAEGEDPAQVADLSAVTAAFQELAAQLGTSWDSLLTSMLERFNLFTVDTTTSAVAFQTGITEQTVAFHEQSKNSHAAYLSALSAAYAAFRTREAAAFAAFLTRESERDAAHRAAMRNRRQAFNEVEASATQSFLNAQASRNRAGGDSIRNRWDDTWAWMSDDSTNFRRREADRLNSFLNGTLMSTVGRFGNDISSEWGKIWNGLVDSAARIFRALPDEIGAILSTTGGRINKHIVNPYNKIVKDLDLKKDLKIGSFPTQKYRDGGMMQGYTPGRDVHTFFSDTGGVLELSGGEPVLRPEVGAVVGSEWVDGVNGAARSKGVTGVKQFLGMGHQAHAEGGFIESFANGGHIKKDRKGIIELGRVLQGLGVNVSEHSAFGGNTGGHSATSWHKRDGALDLNTAPGTSSKEMADFDRIMPMLYKLGWGTIWRYPNHYGHAHVDIGNTSLGNFNRNPKTSGDLWERLLSMKVGPATGGGTSTDFYDIKGEMAGWIKKAQSAVGEGAIPEMFMGASSKLFTELADAKSDQFIETASMGVGMPGDYKPGSGVKRWRPEILEALEMTGNSTSDAMVNIVMRRMNQESGGNPKATNNWDINARRGMASRGLMQVIPPTFQQWRSRSLTNDIWDPLANIVASMRYAKGTYGSLPAAYNKKGGYAEGTSGIELPPVAAPPALDLSPDAIFRDGGGPLPTGYTTVLNNLGHEETILPKTPHEVTKTFEKMVETNTGDGGPKFYDSKFMSDAKETAEEIHRMGRMSRAATPVRM